MMAIRFFLAPKNNTFFFNMGEEITCFVNRGLGLSQTQNKEV